MVDDLDALDRAPRGRAGRRSRPRTSSTSPATARRFAGCPDEKSSSTRTRWPARTRASAMWLPMNPAPPVTRIFIRADFITMRRSKQKVFAEWVCKPDPVPRLRTRAAIIPLAPRLPAGSSNLPGGFGRASLERPPIWSCSVWGLPCPSCHHAGGALLPHLFTLATPAFDPEFGGIFSVALSLRSPSLAVSQHTALGVRTFLPGPTRPRRPPGPLCEPNSLRAASARVKPRGGVRWCWQELVQGSQQREEEGTKPLLGHPPS